MKIKFANTEVDSEGAEWVTFNYGDGSYCVVCEPKHIHEDYKTQAEAEQRLLEILTEIKEGRA